LKLADPVSELNPFDELWLLPPNRCEFEIGYLVKMGETGLEDCLSHQKIVV
jgi:hypothetical protein